MSRLRGIIVSLLALSLTVNGWLGIRLYQNSRTLHMETAEYDSFKLSLSEAMRETDTALNDQPLSTAQRNAMVAANMSLNDAMGLIMGLRVDLAKKGMDIFPIFVALGNSESPVPNEGNASQKKIQGVLTSDSKTLHAVYSTLQSTSFSNAGLNQLRHAVAKLDEKFPGSPSYSSLS